MTQFRKSLSCILILLCGTIISGCFYKNQIRHLASDVGLITPNATTQKEVISFMGFPEVKKAISDTEEEWTYYQENQSLMRRAPLFGRKMGQADYDVAIITFKNQIAISSQYRSFTEEEFHKLGIADNAAQ